MERKPKYKISHVRFRGYFVVDRETMQTLGPFEREIAELRCEQENEKHYAATAREKETHKAKDASHVKAESLS